MTGWACRIVLAVFLLVAGCARPMAPTGGEVPQTPLRVVETRPQSLAQIEPFEGAVEIDFERRISERVTEGGLRDAVVVSPRTGEIEVSTGRRGIEVQMRGGFREPAVYRVTVLPRFQDLYQNRMAGAYELVFSTGPALEPNLLAGLVADRLTLEAVPGARVDAAPSDGGPIHSTVADSSGVFTFPYIPADGYVVVAYEDLNRNREPDFLEPQDSLEVGVSAGDTLIVTELALLAPDTTAAILDEAVAMDTASLRLTFDDHLDPDDPLDEVGVTVTGEDGEEVGVTEILHLHEWEARAQEVDDPDVPEPEPDPDPADLGPDPADPVLPEPAVALAPDDAPLPSREIVVVLSEAMTPGDTYRVEVEGVRNINGVPGGGGSDDVEVPQAPEPADDPQDPADPDGGGAADDPDDAAPGPGVP